MTDTNLAVKEISGSQTAVGSPQVIDQFSPNSGELWYVDEVKLTTDNNDPYGHTYGISSVPNDAASLVDGTTVGNNGNGSRVRGIGDSDYGSQEVAVIKADLFVSPGETLILAEQNTSGSSTVVYYNIQLRRVL